MKFITKLIALLIAIWAVMPVNTALAEETTIIYVSTTGSDEGNGSWENPYLTLSKAVEASRSFDGKRIIRLRGGQYSITSTVNLNSSDTGLTIENTYGEAVELTGGKSIPCSLFTKVTDEAVLNRVISKSGRENLMQVYLPDAGITDYGTLRILGAAASVYFSPSLTYNDRHMSYARYPNDSYLYTKDIIRDGSETSNREVEFTLANNNRYTRWTQAKDIWALSYIAYDWAEMFAPLTIDFETGHMVTVTGGTYYAESGRRIKFMNLLEEIDIPEEHYIDRETGYLYIYPPEDMQQDGEFIFTTLNSRILRISGGSDITVRGIRFSGSLKDAIYASNSPDLKIDACEITNVGDYAITISSCQDAIVSNCYIHDVSGGGIKITGGNRTTLTPGNIRVENCHIERFMIQKRTYYPAVHIEGVGHTVSHCEINDSPHNGILFKGNEHTIEYNEFYELCNDSADVGAIYAGRNWTMRGNVIRYNYFHDMDLITNPTGMKSNAVYLDDCFASAEVYGNYFYNCSSVGLYGGGRYNTFENNIMIENDLPFVFDNRGLNWMSTSDSKMGLTGVPYKTGIWAETYPELVGIKDDQPEAPKHNIIKGNVIYKTPDYNIAAEVYEYGTVEDNITITDTSSFADYKNRDFTVLPDSEIYKKLPGFKTADFKSIGRYPYTYENQAPVPEISELKISGSSVSGNKLSVSYKFKSDGYYEGDTTVSWYISDSAAGPFVRISNNKTFTTTDSMRGRYLMAEVTPVNCEGIKGKAIFTAPFLVHRPTNGEALEITQTDNGISVKNKDSSPIKLAVFSPSYTENNGFKIMDNLTVSYTSILDFAEISCNENDIILTTDNLEPVK